MVTVVNVVTEFEQLLQGYEVRNTCFRVRPSFQRLLSKPPPPPPRKQNLVLAEKQRLRKRHPSPERSYDSSSGACVFILPQCRQGRK